MGAQSQAFEKIDSTKQDIRNYGPGLSNQLNTDASTAQQQGQDFTNWATGQYKDLLANPGYSQSEADAIQGGGIPGGYNSLQFNEGEAGNNFLTPDEQARISGDPNAAQRQFNPNYINDLQQSGFDRQNEQVGAGAARLGTAVGGLRSGLDASVTPDLQLGSDFAHNQDATVVAGAGNVRAADSGQGVRGAVSALRGSVNPGDISASQRYLNKMDVTPQEMDQIRSSGARSVAAQNTAAQQRIKDAIYQSGASDPFAEAALNSQNNRASEASEADAALQGELAAQNTMRGVEQAREDTRMKGAAGTGSLALNIGQAGIGAENSIMNTQTGAEQNLLNTALNTQSQDEQMRLAAAANAAKMRQYNAQVSGQADIDVGKYNTNLGYGNAQNAANTANATERTNQNTQIGLTSDAEKLAQARALALGTNRQGVSASNATQRYNQGMGVAKANTGAATQVAEARRGDLAAGRQYATGQGQFQTGQGTALRGTQTQATLGTLGAENAADTNYVNATKSPSTADKIVGNAATLIGAGSGKAVGGIGGETSAGSGGVMGMYNRAPRYTSSYGTQDEEADPNADNMEDPGQPSGFRKVLGSVGGAVANYFAPGTGQSVSKKIWGQGSQNGQGSAAVGKVIMRPQLTMLGENGPEMVIPLHSIDDGASSMATLDAINPGMSQAVAMRGAGEQAGQPGIPPPAKAMRPILSPNPVPASGGAYA